MLDKFKGITKEISTKNKILAILMVIGICILMFAYNVFAASDVVPRPLKENGIQYVSWEFDHNITQAQYKYYGYGYTVSVVAPGGHVVRSAYLENSQFNPVMDGNKEKVKIATSVLQQDKLQVPEDYLSRSDLKMYLNARMGIKVNGAVTHAYDSYDGKPELGMPSLDIRNVNLDGRTIPLNKDGKGVKDGIEHEYGVNWTRVTQENLEQHFGIEIPLEPAIIWDRYKVKYLEIGTDKPVNGETAYKDFGMDKTVTEYPETVNGYDYSGYYKIDKIDSTEHTTSGNVTEGESVTIDLRKNADRYIITFYYNKIDPSQIGKPVTIEVEYREDTYDQKELIDSKSFLSGERAQFIINSASIDDYTCRGYYVMGQKTEYFYKTNVNFIIGKESYNTPVDGKLKIIFMYKEDEILSPSLCKPETNGKSDDIPIINMKQSEFDKLTNSDFINVNNISFHLTGIKLGYDRDGNIIEGGTHEFKKFNLYMTGLHDTRLEYSQDSMDNSTKDIIHSFKIPFSLFEPYGDNQYRARVDADYMVGCSCGKFGGTHGTMKTDTLSFIINIIPNYPPVANFDYYTEKKLINGDIKKLRRTYIGQETIIENSASDPNGLIDIEYLQYTLTDSSNNEYYIKLLMLQDETYFLDEDNVQAENIEFLGALEDGSIKLKFNTDEIWTISQYVKDLDGLNDTYIKEITPVILNLKPKAIISDAIGYRYPIGVAFNGKQNRVVKYYSTDSSVADFLKDTGVEINHNRDYWQIVPLEGQDINNLNFKSKAGLRIINSDNVLEIKYSYLNTKLQFSEPGKYKIRLQVTDTSGNVSEWAEEIITINEDLEPQITANINPTYLRSSNGIATITIKNIAPKSVDGDSVVMEITDKIKYKYDSDNDNSFDDEVTKELTLLPNGSMYDATLKTSDLGKYQFMLNVSETFGQEYLEEYVTEDDFKKANAVLETHVDNIEPDVTLFEIWTIEN